MWSGLGTASLARIDSVIVCGKTGTSENKKGKDHSVFVAFAPKDNPKIAIAVYVENAGFGGVVAAPIASLIMEKYIKGGISPKRKHLEKFIKEKNLCLRQLHLNLLLCRKRIQLL
jgi:penicillin-binding protein 2